MLATRITVLMPLKHYHPVFLRKAARSIIIQTCPHWRLLIIVEKPDKRKFQTLLEDELRDDRFGIIVNRGRKLAGAINTGMRYTQTDFNALLLADDMWAPESIQVLNDYIEKNPIVDFFHSSRVYINEQDEKISSIYRSKEQISINDFRKGAPVKHLLCWRRKKALSFGGLDETLNSVGPDDYDFPWTMAEHGATFKAIEECLYYYRDHRACYRLTTHLPLSVHKKEIAKILMKHGMDALATASKVERAERNYLRQCLFKSKFDKLIKQLFGYDGKDVWREKYT